MGLLDTINSAGAGAQSGGCWRVVGKATACFGQAFAPPVTLGIGGSNATYGFLDVLPGGDNPDVTDWFCDTQACVALSYGCNTTTVGCSCPGGECPEQSFYRFNTDGCCCPFPCNGDFASKTYFHDLGYTVSAGTTSDFEITSLIVDGTQYIGTPVTFLPPNLISIGGFTYNTSFADTINSLGIPVFTADYPTTSHISTAHANIPLSSMRNNFVRLKFPDCVSVSMDYTYTSFNGTVTTYTLDELSTTFPSPFNGANYDSSKVYDTVTTNEC